MYHHIAVPPPAGTRTRGLFVKPERFRRQMRTLKRLGYQGCSVRDLMAWLRPGRPRKLFGITFDDGYEDLYIHALPVLQECGFTATTYFVSGAVGGFNHWDVEQGFPQSRCMSLQQLQEWKALGHEVGGHTVSHRRLGELATNEARMEIVNCRRVLEDLSGAAVEAFSYPYGSFNAMTLELVEEAGFTTAASTQKKRASATDNPFCLPRLNVRRADTLPSFLWKCLVRN